MNALVHAIEVNDRHGVGIFLRRIFGRGDDFVLFRSRTLYQGGNEFGRREEFLGDRYASMDELRDRLAKVAREEGIKRILCVPYYAEDFRNAVILKEVTGAPLCTYLMDDQNIFDRVVGDSAVARLLEKSDLCLGISPQMCLAYRQKFGFPIGWMPPVLDRAGSPIESPKIPKRVALIGNIWRQSQLIRLRRTMRDSGWRVDWFGRGPDSSWLDATPEDLRSDGIDLCGYLEDEALIARLSEYSFAIVPADADDHGDARAFSLLSLPSRIVYLLTKARMPIMVLGGRANAGGAFVRETGTGILAEYNQQSFLMAAAKLTGARDEYRAAIDRLVPKLVLSDAGEWIWKSLEKGAPADDRFEQLRTGDLAMRPFEVSAREPVRRVRSGWIQRRLHPLHDLESLRFSRAWQLKAIRSRTPLRATGPHSFEVSEYQRALAVAVVKDCLTKGATVGVLEGETSWLRALTGDFQVSSIDGSSRKFDAVVSFNRTEKSSRKELEELSSPCGLQLHFWTAYWLPGHFQSVDAASALLSEVDDPSYVADRILEADDFLFMSPRAIEEFWKPANPQEVAAAGRPFSLNLCWRAE